ncbi:MAG TPA: hypothetical protein DEO68_19145 [Halomonas campaniensis]|uniref:Uncharacterized protein n=2 Tax=Halomonas TaxID=2745 RepID=A0A3D0KL43_9GAMM|nr:hypothetical protein [Halomonas sp. 3F2F]HCA04228.1 hypothetical protein [Halomonas campaniensis]
MSADRPYPHEIKKQWESAIEAAPLLDDEKTNLFNIIDYSQPPVSLTTLKKAAEIYNIDIKSIDIENLIKKLQTLENIKKEKPSHIGTNYSVYYALTHSSHLFQSSSDIAIKCRRYFSHLFGNVDENKSISKSTFYTHVLAARDVISAVIESRIKIVEKSETLGSDIITTINSDMLSAQKNRLKEKIKILSMLSHKILTPGEKQRDYNSSEKQKTASNVPKHDPWHDERLNVLAKTLLPKRQRLYIRRERYKQHDSAVSGPAENALFKMRDIKLKDPNETEESSENTIVQRAASSTLTRTDDIQLVRRRTKSSPTSSLPAITDLARLTDVTIHAVLAQPLYSELKYFAILLLTLGLPPERLMRLTTSEHVDTATDNHHDDRPHWCTAESVLCYRLLDGPSLNRSNPTNQWVQLTLPPSLTEFFKLFPLSERPFRGARSQLNRHLKRYFRNQPGLIPTANRLSASSWLYRRPHAIDDVAATALAGQFGLGLSAPAAYRQLSRKELQHVFDKTLQQLGLFEPTLPVAMPVNANHTSASVGSAVAQPPEFFQSIFSDIRQNMRSSQAEIEAWQSYKPFPADALLRFSQLISAHELLGWQLSTGARPVGPRSGNQLGQKMQWVHDKNSARGIESRVIPILPNVRESIKSLHRWHSLIIHVASSANVAIGDQRTDRLDTPAWLFKPQRGKKLILRDMHWSDLSTLQLSQLINSPRNVARHSFASYLRNRISDAQVDAMLGHARHGRMLSSPRSETPLDMQNYSQLIHALKEWLGACGYQPLDWSRIPWHC